MNVPQAGSWQAKGLWMWMLAVSAIAAAFLAWQAAPAAGQQANTLVVDDDKVQCTEADYQSIQAAVDAATPGTRIAVCDGTYQEQISFGAGKDNIILDGTGKDSTTIKAPDTLAEPGDLVTVNGATGVKIQDFLITGPFPDSAFCSNEARTGVRVYGGGSATLYNNRITEIRSESSGFRGCQNGIAVVYGDYDPSTGLSTTGSGSVLNNVIDRYQKGGIIVSERAEDQPSNVLIRNNTILGVGKTPDLAQNGIQVSYGAQANVQQNTVRYNVYTGPADDQFDAGGIILFGRPDNDTQVRRNIVARNDYNIGLFNASGIDFVHNRATASRDLAGIFVNRQSKNNLFQDNRALNNQQLDCLDNSEGTRTDGTANTWTNDIGQTDSPQGICQAP